MTTLILQQNHQKVPLSTRVRAGIKMVNGWLQRHHQRRQLAQLDGHLLRDIGVDTEQADAEVRKPFWK